MPGGLPTVAGAVGVITLGTPSLVTPRYYCTIHIAKTDRKARGRRRGVPSPLLPACLAWPPLVYVGRISYVLYLVHFPTFVVWRFSLGLRSLPSRLCALALTAVLSMGIYHGVERPVRTWKPKRAWHVLAASLAALFLLESVISLLRGPWFGQLYLLESRRSSLQGADEDLWTRTVAPRWPPNPPPPSAPPAVPLGDPQRPPPPPRPHIPPPTPPSGPCSCSNREGAAHTYHEPPQTNAASATPCFEAYDSYDWDELIMHDDDVRIADHPCAFSGYVPYETARCLAPPRGGGYPENVVFLVGDSHCTSTIPAMNRAVKGLMTLAPACVPGNQVRAALTAPRESTTPHASHVHPSLG